MEGQVKTVSLNDADYPRWLRQIHQPPQVLYYLGEITNLDNCLAVVGSRQHSEYGRQTTKRLLGGLLNQTEIVIVSGLALGIDSLAHWAALENNGRTVAVLGSGFNHIYPQENHQLAKRIVEQGGCLISEYAPDISPAKHHFVARNRIISGICWGTLIIEAAIRSGSLITGRYALEQNREVFAIPGNIYSPTSGGTNNLIKLGAKPVLSVDDILENCPTFDNLT
jgi:DNA processing protein